MRRIALVFLATALLCGACTPADAPPPMVTLEGEDRHLIHPLGGRTVAPPASDRFEAAYRWALAGNETEADRRIADIRQRHPDLLVPTLLLEALVDIRAGRHDDARAALGRVREREPENVVARVYEAEIAIREKQIRVAYDVYRELAASEDVPHARERLTELEAALFNELYAAAQSAEPAESIRLLREALTFNPGAVEPRILLSQRLLGQRQFEEARREIDPLLNSAADRAEVQEILAEVDVGRGRYQEAIVRYDRLARRTREPRHAQRLEEIKAEWSAANMPAHYRAALDSVALTRADLAVLLYWTVPSVRFAQNLGAPQIAVDVEGLAGREEIIRAIALGLYEVDPVTRRVSPYRTVPASRFATHLARVLSLRGAPCARGLATDRVLAACGVEDPLATFAPDATLTGRDALRYLQQVAAKF